MTSTITPLQNETRLYQVPPAFAAQANIDAAQLARLSAQGAADPVGFWERAARRLTWEKPWHTAHSWSPPRPVEQDGQVVDWTVPQAEWFAGGKLNVAANCVDRHVAAGLGGKPAIHFEGEPGDRRTLTYADLLEQVSKAANALEAMGVGQGDRVVVYLPVIPETIIVTLAIARIGAVHSLVFGGFSADAVRFRLADTKAKLLVTTDGQFRRGVKTQIKGAADAAAEGLDHVEHVLVVRRTGQEVPWTPGRDLWWHEVVGNASPRHRATAFDAETPLFIIYTSGTTGRPKGLVHTMGGYLVQTAWTHWAHFDAKPDDVHWCTADLAWVTAHSYEIYGPLANGLTQVIYEGTPDTPHAARHFEIIERYGVTIYYTAPTVIRMLAARFPDGPPPQYDLSSLRLLGTVGESINPEAWVYFHQKIGGGRAPIVDTWWQSETGATIVSPLPGATPLKPGSATFALPGLEVAVVDDAARPVPPGQGGYLVITRPWPAMARTVWGDPGRYLHSYWRKFAGRGDEAQGYFLAGDGAAIDADGYLWILGRLDEVINAAGHRLSTIEIESALVTHPFVREAGVTGVDHPIKGQVAVAFVIPTTPPGPAGDLDTWHQASLDAAGELRAHVRDGIGPVAQPAQVLLVPDLPRTRSGKIMRRLLGELHDSKPLGDMTSLQNAEAIDRIEAALAHRRAAPKIREEVAV
ncbi:MAG: acetate--CoA ligase [Bifidobacteriaceae bacterium]|jgi:acetyl-CoA synthetase|nr:acetate--CoA ligase [Bifidobacteriaceae bacterium]